MDPDSCEETATVPPPSKVPDLLAALEASLAEARAARERYVAKRAKG